MQNKLLTAILAGTMASFMVSACAEESKDVSDTMVDKTVASTEEVAKTADQGESLMNQPVNFSTPEDVEKTLQNIREKEGDKAYNTLKNTIQYLLVYDLSVGHDKEKLYKKLNGKTPEQIITNVQR